MVVPYVHYLSAIQIVYRIWPHLNKWRKIFSHCCSTWYVSLFPPQTNMLYEKQVKQGPQFHQISKAMKEHLYMFRTFIEKCSIISRLAFFIRSLSLSFWSILFLQLHINLKEKIFRIHSYLRVAMWFSLDWRMEEYCTTVSTIDFIHSESWWVT